MNASILKRLKQAALVSLTVLAPMFFATNAVAGQASYTTTNASVDGAGHCFNGGTGGDPVNCNIYDAKSHVWLNGGPIGAAFGPGSYFFAVMDPSGQGDPNDGTDALLSFDLTGDPYTNRTFTVGNDLSISYGGTHDVGPLPKIRFGIAPDWYDTTSNHGGTYIVAICRLAADGSQPSKKDCKFDAFKIIEVPPPPPCPCGGEPNACLPCPCECGERDQNGECPKSCVTGPILNISKDANGIYTNKWPWTITKSASPLVRYLTSGSATFNYTVTAAPALQPNIVDVSISGNITVDNSGDSPAVDAVVADALVAPLTGLCSITDPSQFTIIAASSPATSGYVCNLPDGPIAANPGANEAQVTWTALAGSQTASTVVSVNWGTPNEQDECVTVTDTVQGNLSTELCVGGNGTFTYTRTIPAVSGCVTYPNTASFLTLDTSATGSANASVTVCAPVVSGARTIGYWHNKNGQAVIKGGTSTAGVCDVGTYLRTLAPFQDLSASANCNTVASYYMGIFNSASSAGAAMNSMLKAQMIATALNSYFKGIGGLDVDLTKICKSIGSCGTPPTGYEITSAAFGGLSVKHLTVDQLLAYAASQSNAGGGAWYGQVKAMQALAKDTFDAINNEVVFEWFPGP